MQQVLNTQNPNTVPTPKSVYEYFTIKRLPRLSDVSVPSVKWSRTGLYVFESRVTKTQRNLTKLVLRLCQLFPQSWENFRITQGLCPSGPRKVAELRKVRIIEVFL